MRVAVSAAVSGQRPTARREQQRQEPGRERERVEEKVMPAAMLGTEGDTKTS